MRIGIAPEFERQVAVALTDAAQAVMPVLTKAEISILPTPVQRYLHNSGCIDKPRPSLVQMAFDAEMMRSPGKTWMPGSAEQFNRFDVPKRMFFMRSRMFGLPVEVLHDYREHQASMKVRMASIFNLVDIKTDELARTETVTLLNDLCFFAPAWLADPRMSWREVNDRCANVVFTSGPHQVSASLSFDHNGDLVNFESNDRGALQGNGQFRYIPWSTPMQSYREFSGSRVPSYGEAIWHYPEGNFVYGRFHLRQFTVT